MADTKFISAAWLARFSSPHGGHKRAQIEALGLSWPPPTAWKERLVGKPITDEMAAEFERLAGDFALRRPVPKPKLKPTPQPPVTQKERQEAKERKKAKKLRKAGGTRALQVKIAPPPSDVTSDAFLSSFAWRQLRMKALMHYGAKCMCCGATPATGEVMNVDHIKPRKLWPSLALDLNNLQILCGTCNHGKGNWSTKDWRHAEKA